jgi:hypothetical protein
MVSVYCSLFILFRENSLQPMYIKLYEVLVSFVTAGAVKAVLHLEP